MTSQVLNISMLLFQDWTSTSIYLIHPKSPLYDLALPCLSPTPVSYMPWFLLSSSYNPQASLCADYSGVSFSQITNMICHFLISLSCRNLGMRFLLMGEGYNTPCYGKINQGT
jgi:hypothetical protein